MCGERRSRIIAGSIVCSLVMGITSQGVANCGWGGWRGHPLGAVPVCIRPYRGANWSCTGGLPGGVLLLMSCWLPCPCPHIRARSRSRIIAGSIICSLVMGIASASLSWIFAPQVRFLTEKNACDMIHRKERRGHSLHGLKDFYVKAKARIWPELLCVCQVRHFWSGMAYRRGTGGFLRQYHLLARDGNRPRLSRGSLPPRYASERRGHNFKGLLSEAPVQNLTLTVLCVALTVLCVALTVLCVALTVWCVPCSSTLERQGRG